jgi:hypothetical protein
MITALVATSPWWSPTLTGAVVGLIAGLMF